ncbi:MAG: tetratricopeptide repeat-containing sulfotransferase family protein [Steroidobacteraceae bacterium]
MARDLEADRATLRAVQQAAQRGDHAQAAALAQTALANGLEHPLLLNVVALNLEQNGRVAEAQSMLRRAVQIAPEDLSSRNALGLCLMRLGRPGRALEQFEALLKIDSSLPYAHASRGNAQFALGAIAEAEASYRRALEIDADQGIALAGLARIASNRGSYPEARSWAQKALALVPDYPDAVMSLATAELRERQPQRAEARIRALVADGRVAPQERAHANGLLGDILDAENRPAEAFAAYQACNEALQQLYAPRFGRGGALEFVRSMIRYFERSRAEDWKPRAPGRTNQAAVRGHVFLLGFPRSGTTLLEVILEGHPNVVSLEENESLIDSVHEFMRRPEDLDRLAGAGPQLLEAAREAYWRLVAGAGADVTGKLFVDKHPLNTLKLPVIARLFPDAKILFACRDPRDVVLSCFRHRFYMSAPIYELLSIEGAARYYDAVMQLMLRLTAALTLDTCLVRHEDLVTEFAREMKRICTYLGLDWVPAMGDFALRTKNRTVLTPSTAQLVRGLNTEGIGQWRRYREQLAPVLAPLDPWVKRFYYDP